MLGRTTVALSLALYAPALLAQTPHQASALRGLRTVRVLVAFRTTAPLGPAAADTVLLRRLLEVELRHAGLATGATGGSTPQLALKVTVLSRADARHVPRDTLDWLSYRLDLRQWAMIQRQPPAYVWATTWGLEGVGFAQPSHVAAEIVLSVHQLVRTFVEEYRADNAARP